MIMTMMIIGVNKEREDDRSKGGSGSGAQKDEEPTRIFTEAIPLTSVPGDKPVTLYLCHDVEEGEFIHNYAREEIMEMMGINDESFKFDFEKELDVINPDEPESYVFKYIPEANDLDNVVVEDNSDSDNNEPYRYSGEGSEDFPTFKELFSVNSEDLLYRKVEERVCEEGEPSTMSKEYLREARKKWFRKMPKERKFKRMLAFFMRHPYTSLVKREFGIQCFKHLIDIKTLPWWYVEELCETNILHYGVRFLEHRLWTLIKHQAMKNFPDWNPHYPKKTVKIDEVTGGKDVTLHVKRPRVMRNMPLRKMDQDFYDEFKGWYYDPETAEAVICLRLKENSLLKGIRLLDPIWLVNCLKKDIECLFFTKIWYLEEHKVQAMQYKKVINVC
ncbi:hypothetical protein Hanom_Chr02g00120091 [Helianthus anomalus]